MPAFSSVRSLSATMGRAYTRLRVVFGALLLLAALPSVAQAGEVTLANGDVLRGRTWKDGGVLHIDHPALGLIKLSPQHFRKAVLDADLQRSAAPALSGTPSSALRPILCAPPKFVDAALTPKCKSPYTFALGTGFSVDGGNTDKQQLNLDVDAGYEWRRLNSLAFRTTNFYEQANGVQTEGKYFGSLRYDREISSRDYLFGLWLAQRDDFSDIELRTGWTVGAGHHFIKREKEHLKGELGVGFFLERRTNVDALETASGFAGMEYKRTFADGDYFEARAWTVQYLDNRDLSPYQVQLRYGHPIRAHFDITASFLFDYVENPPPGIRAHDTKFVVGLRWRPTEGSK